MDDLRRPLRSNSKETLRFIALCLLIYGLINFLPYIFGYAPIVGDNLTQNAPLRHLVAQAYLSGHLPLMNIFGWSGTPLLAGFNAGAYYPLEVLYLFLPTQIATLAFITILQLTFGIGLRQLGRSMGYSPFAVNVIAISAPGVSYFYAQTIHLDMASGIAVIPFALLAIYRQSKGANGADSIKNGVLLGVAYALIVLGGAPEAMLFGGAYIGTYLLCSFLVNRVSLRTLATFIAVALLVAVTLSAPQLLPGYSYISSSQRANLPSNYATAGPFYPQMFVSLVTPFIFGSPSQILPNYQGPYTFEETLVYIGVLPLLAAIIALASIFRSKSSRGRLAGFAMHESKRFDLVPLLIAGTVSALLSLGSYTPLESVMLHVPIYKKQRLPSRNIIGFEISSLMAAMAGLEALVLRKVSKRFVLGMAFAFALTAGGLIVGIVLGGNGSLYAFDGSGTLNPFGSLSAVSLIPATLILAFTIVYARPTKDRTIRLSIAAIVAIDLLSFDLFSYTTSGFSNSVSTAKGSLATAFTSLMKKERGRFAIYDPNLYYYFDDIKVGIPNLNTYNQIPSIQGYGSLSLANYEAATGSHQQATLIPSLPSSSLFSLLEGKVLLTGNLYFSYPVGQTFTTYGSPNLIGQPQSTNAITDSTFLGAPLYVTSIQLTYGYPSVANAPTSVTTWSKIDKGVGVVNAQGRRVVAKEVSETKDPKSGAAIVTYALPHPTVATQIFADEYISAKDNPSHAIAAGTSVETVNAGRYTISGGLAKNVTPSDYKIGPSYNALTAYIKRDLKVSGITAIKETQPSQQSIPYLFSTHGDLPKLIEAKFDGPNQIQYQMSTASATTIIVSLAYNSGWHAELLSGTTAKSIPVSECNQAITCLAIPSSRGKPFLLELTYAQKGAKTGLALGGVGLLATGVLLSQARRRDKDSKR
ncbi:MAG: hypothetical protein M0T78_03470 [Actinomycetota bacterium]|nr:hypothetical protein [Actinomycetota bacterium]